MSSRIQKTGVYIRSPLRAAAIRNLRSVRLGPRRSPPRAPPLKVVFWRASASDPEETCGEGKLHKLIQFLYLSMKQSSEVVLTESAGPKAGCRPLRRGRSGIERPAAGQFANGDGQCRVSGAASGSSAKRPKETLKKLVTTSMLFRTFVGELPNWGHWGTSKRQQQFVSFLACGRPAAVRWRTTLAPRASQRRSTRGIAARGLNRACAAATRKKHSPGRSLPRPRWKSTGSGQAHRTRIKRGSTARKLVLTRGNVRLGRRRPSTKWHRSRQLCGVFHALQRVAVRRTR